MSPPEVWGPSIWRLFHTLAENINDNVYKYIYPQLFFQIQRICKFLPCPECSKDASIFLAKVKLSDLKTKTDFINILYLFHNYVNAKKKKPLFNYSNINIYKNYRIIYVVNNFIAVYNTKGNMKLIAESFQRQFIIKDFKNWIINNIKFFIPVSMQNTIQLNITDEVSDIQEEIIEVNPEVISEVTLEHVEEIIEVNPEPVKEIIEVNPEPIPEPGKEIIEVIPEPVKEIIEVTPEPIPESLEVISEVISEVIPELVEENNVSINDMTIEEIYKENSLEETVVVAPIIKKKKNKNKKKN